MVANMMVSRAGASKFTRLFIFTFLFINTGASFVNANAADELSIRTTREASNSAIVNQDIEAFIMTLMPDYHVVTAANMQLSGHEDQRRMMKSLFRKYPDAIYVRTPLKIDVNPAADTAAETGSWTGTWTQSGKLKELQGSYFSKWTRLNGVWLIQAEVFVIF